MHALDRIHIATLNAFTRSIMVIEAVSGKAKFNMFVQGRLAPRVIKPIVMSK